MPVKTRAKAPADCVYSSPAVQQQVRFKPRKQRVTSRRSLGALQRPRQQTLTQIDFVNLQQTANQNDDNENETDHEREQRPRKRRRTEGGTPASSSTFYTQTLTQLEFVSTPASRLDDLDDVENDLGGTSSDIKQEANANLVRSMGPPKTPSRRRVYEVPSSQSPLSPTSSRSRRSFLMRSPLRPLDANLQVQLLSPVLGRYMRKSPAVKSEIQDTYQYENESQQSRVPQTPQQNSSPTKSQGRTAEARLTRGTQTNLKDEIQDSDEEDEGLDTYYDNLNQESQVNQYRLNSLSPIGDSILTRISRDTQEAEEQLQSTMLQFTQQQILSTAEEYVPIRPSQATTVSLTQTQPPTSSPIFSRRPNHEMPPDAVLTDDDQGHLLVPDSPSYQIASSQILTRSQMLPESLMNNSVPAAPLLIEDSDYEE